MGEEKRAASISAEAGLAMFAATPFLGHAVWLCYTLARRLLAEPAFTVPTIADFALVYSGTLLGAYLIGVVPSAIGTLIYVKLTCGVQRLAQRAATAALVAFLVSAASFLPTAGSFYPVCILAGVIAALAAAFLFDRHRD